MEKTNSILQTIKDYVDNTTEKIFTKAGIKKTDLKDFFQEIKEEEISIYNEVISDKLLNKTTSDAQKIDFLSKLQFYLEYRKKIKPIVIARLLTVRDALCNPKKYKNDELDAIRTYIRFFDFPVKNSSCELIAIYNADFIEKIKKGDINEEVIDKIIDFEIQNFFILQNGWKDENNPGFEYLLFDKSTGFTNKTILDYKEYNKLNSKENFRAFIINNIFKIFKSSSYIIPTDEKDEIFFKSIRPFYFSIIDKLYNDSLDFINKKIQEIPNSSESFVEFCQTTNIKPEDIKQGIRYFCEDLNQYQHNQPNAVKTKIDSFSSCIATLLLIKEMEIPFKVNILNQETREIHSFEFKIDPKTKNIIFDEKYIKNYTKELNNEDKELRNNISLEMNIKTTKDLEMFTEKIEKEPFKFVLLSLIILYRGLTPKDEKEAEKAEEIYKRSLEFNSQYEAFYHLLIKESCKYGLLMEDKAPFYKFEIPSVYYRLMVEHIMNSSSPRTSGLKDLKYAFDFQK